MRPAALLLAVLALLCGPVQPADRAGHRAHRRHRRHSRQHRRLQAHPQGRRPDRRQRQVDRRPHAAAADRRLHGSRRGHARGARSADGPRAAGQGRRRPRLRAARQSRGDEPDRRHARRHAARSSRPSPTPSPRSAPRSRRGRTTRSSAAAKKDKGEPVPTVYAQTREAWLTTHPPGFVEYREALRPAGQVRRVAARQADRHRSSTASIFMHAGIPPDNAPAKIDELNEQRPRRDPPPGSVRRAADRPASSALPFFTLQEILQVASSEIGARQRAASPRRKAEGKEPDRGKLNVPLLMEAQEILKIDTWLSIDPEGALWYRGLSTVPDDPTGGPFAALLRTLRREAVRHRPHAAAEPLDHGPLRRPRGADRYRDADELSTRAARRRWRSTATS